MMDTFSPGSLRSLAVGGYYHSITTQGSLTDHKLSRHSMDLAAFYAGLVDTVGGLRVVWCVS
jgi:hypothetical protein